VSVPQTDAGGQVRSAPRRTGDPSSRNSANLPRNFGRRGARGCVGDMLPEADAGRREWAQATVTKNTGPCEAARRGIGG